MYCEEWSLILIEVQQILLFCNYSRLTTRKNLLLRLVLLLVGCILFGVRLQLCRKFICNVFYACMLFYVFLHICHSYYSLPLLSLSLTKCIFILYPHTIFTASTTLLPLHIHRHQRAEHRHKKQRHI